MALPWLESRNVWGDERPSGSKASEAPVRLCVTFSGNGFHSKEWWAKGEGDKMELGRVLQPLTEFRSKLLFVRGLYHEEAHGLSLIRAQIVSRLYIGRYIHRVS